MNESYQEYIQSLLADKDSLPKGKQFVEEGIAIGKKIKAGKNKFLEDNGFESELDFRKDKASKGEAIWSVIMGLATVEDQLAALNYLYEFQKRTGVNIDVVQHIPNMLTGLPKEFREKAPKGTSFILENPEDWQWLVDQAPFLPMFGDDHIGSPNALYNTVNAIKNGSAFSGVFAQFAWDFPYYNDEVAGIIDNLKAIGVVAAKYDEKFVVDSYLDDGIPGYFQDYCSYVGYAMLEKYIVTDLCGARFGVGFGQLIDDAPTKSALHLAINDLLKTDDQVGVSYVYGNAMDHWDHDLEGNYGISAQEMLLQLAVERKFKTGSRLLPVPITEKVAVPTPEAIANTQAVGHRLEEKLDSWMELISFAPIEEKRDLLKEQGQKFFNNIIKGFEDAGVDVKDPLHMMLALKRMNAPKLEQMFHPSVWESPDGEFTAYVPTTLSQHCLDEKDLILNQLLAEGYGGKLKGKKVAVVSADGHFYGAFVVDKILTALEAESIYGGIEIDPMDALDLADEENIEYLCVSAHNGQSLDYAKQIMDFARERNKNYRVFIGGKLNAILPGNAEPTDVTDLINEMGVLACNTIKEMVDGILKDG
jgi:methylmalonyl-CoA mutase cobalamin-binding subunit